jgi:hypothetical protein
VAFAPDGHTLVTGSVDRSVILWDLANLLFVRDGAAQIECTRSAGGLNPDEWNHLASNLPYEDSALAGARVGDHREPDAVPIRVGAGG